MYFKILKLATLKRLEHVESSKEKYVSFFLIVSLRNLKHVNWK